jgi:glycine cleavage system aminomethyltransferase T
VLVSILNLVHLHAVIYINKFVFFFYPSCTSCVCYIVIDGAPIKDTATGAVIGTITSGTFSPSLGRAIAMGYINTSFSKDGTAVGVEVRGKIGNAEVAKMPFVPTRYFK